MIPGNVRDDLDLAECVDLVPVGAIKLLQGKGSVEGNTALLLVFLENWGQEQQRWVANQPHDISAP